jgi:hypothetical protein
MARLSRSSRSIGRTLFRAGLKMRRLAVRLFTRPGAETEDNRRRMHLGMSLGPVVPVGLAFGVADLLAGAIEGLVAIGIGLVALAFLFTLSRVRRGVPFFRLAAFLLGLAALFYLWKGQFGGATAVWIFPFPLAVFFLLGHREGTIWVGVTLVAVAAMLFLPDIFATYRYEIATAGRGLVSLTLVSMFSFFFESIRAGQYRRVVRQNARLNHLLREVKTLTGLLPICASCKRIRDDQGYWDQVEHYVAKRSSATFSHSICPDCAKKLYGIDTAGTNAPDRAGNGSPTNGESGASPVRDGSESKERG